MKKIKKHKKKIKIPKDVTPSASVPVEPPPPPPPPPDDGEN